MRFTKYAAALAVMMVCVPALADEPAHPGGGALREACTADVKQFCANVAPGGGRVMRCLRDNEDKLSQPCKDARAAARAKVEHKTTLPEN